jgi:ADP-ribosyl-[dinitrogen reductase] hydrolase
MSDTTTAEGRCRGVLFGLAAGDQIGGPIRMAVRLAESLLDCGCFDPDDLLERYLGWWREGAFDTGPVSGRALALMASGKRVPDATAQVHREFGGKTAGCNPAHRSPPLSMLASLDDDDLPECAMTEARLTHYDSVAGEVAAAVNKLCRSLIRGVCWEDAVLKSGSFVKQDGPGSNGGFAPDVLRAALHFVGMSACFVESLVFAAAANYSPVLVGAIGGACWGASAIPQASLAHGARRFTAQDQGEHRRSDCVLAGMSEKENPAFLAAANVGTTQMGSLLTAFEGLGMLSSPSQATEK